ncbi:MAG: HTR-like protein, partial [Methanomicrobiales archaeon HGW-Methanomicrobiales-4]
MPFIIFTGHEEERVVIEALNNGADFYLKKSYDNRSQFFELAQIIRLTIARVQSEELLRKSEEKFRTIAEYSSEWMYWIDPHGTMVYISPSCKQITG